MDGPSVISSVLETVAPPAATPAVAAAAPTPTAATANSPAKVEPAVAAATKAPVAVAAKVVQKVAEVSSKSETISLSATDKPLAAVMTEEEKALARAKKFGTVASAASVANLNAEKKLLRAQRFGLPTASATENVTKGTTAAVADPVAIEKLKNRAERFGVVSKTLEAELAAAQKAEEVLHYCLFGLSLRAHRNNV